METVNIFIASSMRGEFEKQRKDLANAIHGLNELYKNDGVQVRWIGPESMSNAMTKDGSQGDYDKAIEESELFFMIVGRSLGEHTYHEFHVAWKRYFSVGSPNIFPYFLLKGGEMPAEKTSDFYGGLKSLFKYYPKTFADWNDVKLEIMDELLHYVSNIKPSRVPPGENLKARILGKYAEADELLKEGLTWEKLPQILKLYSEIDRAEEELEETNASVPPRPFHVKNKIREARRELALGACYAQARDYERAERSYKKARDGFLEASDCLDADYSDTQKLNAAAVCNHLGVCSAKAMDDYLERGESYYGEALNIYWALEEKNHDAFHVNNANNKNVRDRGMVYGNLATLYATRTGCEKGAEEYFEKSLKDFRALAEIKPDEYGPLLAQALKNQGLFEKSRGNWAAAKRCFTEAASQYETLRLTRDAQECREHLAQLAKSDDSGEPVKPDNSGEPPRT